MERLITDVQQYVEENIGTFHHKRIASLSRLKLTTVLKKKNPYLFRAKSLLTSELIVRALTDAFISSNEETIFGDWLEGLAIFINERVYQGRKSGISGIDLEFDKEGIRYLVNIKSGPNWGNKSQVDKMLLDFMEAKRTLLTSGAKTQVAFVNGCCYGRDDHYHKFPKKGPDYLKYCGQRFWAFISGDDHLYTELIEPIGHKAREKNEIFMEEYAKVINKFTAEFSTQFCGNDGSIDWQGLVTFNSGVGSK